MSGEAAIVEERMGSGFNEHHKRSIRVGFQCVDSRLAEAESVLAGAGSPSPFTRHADDSTPIQRKVVHDYIVRIRETMRRVLAELDIALAPPVCGALWAASTSVLFASIDIEEISPSRMLGHGQLSGDAAIKLQEIGVEMKSMLGKLSAFLAMGSGGDFQARIARLDQAGGEAPLLRELARIVTAHGLVEFREVLEMLLERMESTVFEIGVFGRVSSGKSSLLDYLLETDALPVGVTPVTAVPTRVSYGAAARARIEFAQGQPRTIELSALPAYASEQQNPGNAKHVTRIAVELPTRCLREGVVFVDTPGLGSLAASGSEETLAYLPRCDLGMVLVDASAGLTTGDLQVIHALDRAGAAAMVLLSKADLFNPGDRDRMMAYVREHLRTEGCGEPEIHAISVVGEEAALCEQWWKNALEPKLEAHRQLAAESRKRKVLNLREAVREALELRLRANAPAGDGSAVFREKAHALIEAERLMDAELHRTPDLSHSLEKYLDAIAAALADAVARAWSSSPEADVRRLFSETLTQVLAEPIGSFPHRYSELRRQLADALQQTAGISGESALAELPFASGLPVLDTAGITEKLALDRPKLLRVFGEGLLARHVRKEFEARVGADLRGFLFHHGRRLRDWLDMELRELQKAFDAAADLYRARSGQSGMAGAGERAPMEQDLHLLKEWAAEAQTTPVSRWTGSGQSQTDNGVCLPLWRENCPTS